MYPCDDGGDDDFSAMAGYSGIDSTTGQFSPVDSRLIGSANLLESSKERAHALRKAVTSPKGTTEAGLNVLMKKDAFFNLTSRAIQKAQKRGRELGKS